jgi:hypothetical protein
MHVPQWLIFHMYNVHLDPWDTIQYYENLTPQINLNFHTTLKTISFIFTTETVYIGRYELHVYIQLIRISCF